MSSAGCTHLDQIAVREMPRSVAGCEDCLRIGSKWLHLRICLTCGHVGCCDNSPERHASAHAHATHPIIRSLEPGEDWNWCYIDEVAFSHRGHPRDNPDPAVATHGVAAVMNAPQGGIFALGRRCTRTSSSTSFRADRLKT